MHVSNILKLLEGHEKWSYGCDHERISNFHNFQQIFRSAENVSVFQENFFHIV
jgi:hypothetical protein